ncbi:hypothetical protein GGI03_004084 [Coemansia sp. RSA 2337]|nr:hypothetical protein H4S03_005709 [Coemansia sp. S3946]KAJ2071009.1 hypothetical protein GGH13_003639 [Coemansia sp. S155-1]KAJ2463059.1 hypothetical protein GGI03_004084 [Coemansia sp. RSA 2337]
MSEGPAMTVGTCQQADEYEKTIEYIRNLCEGRIDVNGHELTPPSANATGECVRDSANGFGKSGGAMDDSRPTKAPSGEKGPLAMPMLTPHSREASAHLTELSPAKPRTRQKTNGATSPAAKPSGQNGKQENGAACRHNGAPKDAANDTCDTCGQPGQFICCELCPRVFHFLCVEPPMSQEEVSKIDHWYCRACQHLVTRKRKSRAHAKNIFYPLLSALEFQNAHTFSVPEDIRRQFDGIEADIDGTFINTREDRPQRVNLGAANRDFTRLVDDHNTPIMCYRCGLSALQGPVVRCDYCPLNWHWDCLDPPLSSAPPSRKRWMCPNHADHVMPRRHKFRKERIVDLTDAPEGTRNSGIIDIVDDDPPCQELFDPKVKYRLTSTRICKEFSKNAYACRVFPVPTPPKQTFIPDLSIGSVEPLAVDTIDDDNDDDVAKWLLAMTDFQKDVVRHIATPELREKLRYECRKRRYDDLEPEETTVSNDREDKIALLNDAALQILTPHITSTGLNTPILSSTSSGLVNGAAEMSIAIEPDAQLYSKRRRVLEEHGVCEADFKAAATQLLTGRLLSNSVGLATSSCAGGDASLTLADSSSNNNLHTELTTAISNIALELPHCESEPSQVSISTVQIPELPIAVNEVDESRQVQIASASNLIESLLRKKGVDALVEFLLSD